MKYIYENYTHHKFEETQPEKGKRRVKLLHYVQSFSPDDNVTPGLAHRMGLAFIRKAFGDNVQVVMATHLDKAHIHNHIIINTYGIDGHKYNDNQATLAEIREHSDRVCLAWGIQPIMNNKHQGMTYREWEARRKGTSWKEQTKRDIDTLVLCCKNFDELAATLEERGYRIKYGNYTSILAPGAKRFIRLKTLGEDYTIDGIKSRIEWRDDLGNASRDDSYNNGGTLTICFAGIIAELAKRIVDGTKKENKHEEKLPYLPHNDRDVYQLGAQLALINRLNIHSIGDVEAKMEDAQAAYDSAVKEYNSISEEYHRLDDLLVQYDNFCALNDKPNKTLAEKMKLQLAKQSLFRHGIKSPEDARQLELQKREYDDRIAEIQKAIDDNDYLIRALREIAATYLDISYGDYISKLIAEKKAQQEIPPENTVHEKETPIPTQTVSALKHDEPRQEAPKNLQKQDEPKQENSAHKPTEQKKPHKRGRG